MGAKRLLVIFLVTARSLSSTQAQISKSITKVLDNCAKTFKSAGDVKAQFVATQFEGRDEIGSSRGTISISGKKLFIDNGGVKIWYDGKTQWSLVSDNKEVNITEPSPQERSQMNPYSFLSIYKNGYSATMTSETVRNESCYCVNLVSTKSKNYMQTILLTISKSTMLPICIRTKTSPNKWTRISIYDFEKRQRFKDDMFRFDSADYPGVEIVDLR